MHRHPTVFVLTILAAVIVGNFAVDIIYAAWPSNPAVAGFKQAVTGA